jgi:hypothetical protein
MNAAEAFAKPANGLFERTYLERLLDGRMGALGAPRRKNLAAAYTGVAALRATSGV